jgi:hypothetical protein
MPWQWGQLGLAAQGGKSPDDGYAIYPNTTAFDLLVCVFSFVCVGADATDADSAQCCGEGAEREVAVKTVGRSGLCGRPRIGVYIRRPTCIRYAMGDTSASASALRQPVWITFSQPHYVSKRESASSGARRRQLISFLRLWTQLPVPVRLTDTEESSKSSSAVKTHKCAQIRLQVSDHPKFHRPHASLAQEVTTASSILSSFPVLHL